MIFTQNNNNIVVEKNKKFINLRTGEEVEKKNLKNAIVISLDVKGKGYIEQKRKPFSKYIYKTKQGNYIASNSLNIKFLIKVLTNIYKKNAFFLTDKSFAKNILILGDKVKIVDSSNKEEIILFFQGIEPKEITFTEIINLVQPKNNKKLIIAVAIIFFLLLLTIINSSSEDDYYQISNIKNNTIKKKNSIKKEKADPTKNIKLSNLDYQILRTNHLIQQLFSLKDLAYKSVWIQQIDFNNNRVNLASLKIEPGFKKNNSFYFSKNIIFKLNEKELKKYYLYFKNYQKTFNECRKYIESLPFSKINGINENETLIEYSIKKTLNPEDVENLLKNLLYCPISISGTITTDIKKLQENTNLTIALFKIKNGGKK